MALKVIKTSQVSPATEFVDPLVLTLSFFDLQCVKLNHTEQVLFYELSSTESSHDFFYSLILPKLERSLSLALTHFRQITGHLKWDPQDPKPLLFVSPQDTLSLTVVESDADFSRISGKGLRPELELRGLVPALPVSSDSASVFSMQITFFPNQGFCIAITVHHVVMDGKTAAKFFKSWAHICKYGSIPKDIPTLLDRTVINVPIALEQEMMQLLPYLIEDKNDANTLNLPPLREMNDVVRTTLELTQENIEQLREKAKKESARSELHLSTFVVTYAYVLTCMVKARGGDANRPVRFMYDADFRERLDPVVPPTYFGNCILPIDFYGYKAKTFMGEDGFVNAVNILSDSIKGLSFQGIESIWKIYEEGTKTMELDTQLLSVAGSNQFGSYETDFGWGRPTLIEFLCIYQNDEFSMSKKRDEPRGVEIGISLKKPEMDVFISLFENGLKKPRFNSPHTVLEGLEVLKKLSFKVSGSIPLSVSGGGN